MVDEDSDMKKKLVIVGEGNAGFKVIKHLQKELVKEVIEVTFVFEKKLTIEEVMERTGLREEKLPSSYINIINEEVLEINFNEKNILLSKDEISYDYLILSFEDTKVIPDIEGINEYAWILESSEKQKQLIEKIEADLFKQHLTTNDSISILVYGGGVEEIEFLSLIKEMMPNWCNEYNIPMEKFNLYCVEKNDSILSGFDPELANMTKDYLKENGVHLYVNTLIKSCHSHGVLIENKEGEEEFLDAEYIIMYPEKLPFSIKESSILGEYNGKVTVNSELRLKEEKDVFVLGDYSHFVQDINTSEYLPSNELAAQQGDLCAKNIKALLVNKRLITYKPKVRYAFCSIDKQFAVGIVNGRKIYGKKALWLRKLYQLADR